MADYEALVEISTGDSTFKICGTEKFVEKMIETLPELYPVLPASAIHDENDEEPEKKNQTGGAESLDDFIARVKLTNGISEVRKVTAFVYYLTEIEKAPSCTKKQVEECFDLGGLTTPNNLGVVINNAAKAQNGAYVRSVSNGNYGVTTGGKNLVKTMAKEFCRV